MIGVAATVLLFLSQSCEGFGAAQAVASSSAAAPITITSTASPVYQSTYATTAYSSSYATPSSGYQTTYSTSYSSSYASPSGSICWWVPEGATSYAQPSATVTLVPTTTWAGGVASTAFATVTGALTQVVPGGTTTAAVPAATQVTPGGTTTAAAIAARNNNGSATSVTSSAAGTQNATTFYPTIIYADGTATAYPTAYPTVSINGSVLVCAGPNGTAAVPVNATIPSNSTYGESLKSTGNEENGAAIYMVSGIAVAATFLALAQHILI